MAYNLKCYILISIVFQTVQYTVFWSRIKHSNNKCFTGQIVSSGYNSVMGSYGDCHFTGFGWVYLQVLFFWQAVCWMSVSAVWSRAYFNCLSGGTNVPPLLGYVPPLICVPPLILWGININCNFKIFVWKLSRMFFTDLEVATCNWVYGECEAAFSYHARLLFILLLQTTVLTTSINPCADAYCCTINYPAERLLLEQDHIIMMATFKGILKRLSHATKW